MGWRSEDLRVSLVRDMTSHPVVTISIATPIGELIFMGEPEPVGGTLMCMCRDQARIVWVCRR